MIRCLISACLGKKFFHRWQILCAALVFVVQASAPKWLPANEDRPNIIFMLADDLGYADLGCFGSPVIKTPNIDRLASQGVQLRQCYAASPNCSPARTGILTGRSPYRVGMYDFARFPQLHIPTSEVTLPELLQQAGYQTMFAGKWHCSGRFNVANQPQPGDHGFDHWFAHAGNFGHNPTGFVRNGKKLPKQQGWMSEIVVDETLRWLESRDTNQPFCTFLWFSEPHAPVVADDEFLQMYQNEETDAAAKQLKFGGPQVNRTKADWNQKHHFFGCVSMLDHHVGRFLDQLDEMGLAENTIVVFTSDNGPEHRRPDSFGSPGNLRGAKGHIHDGGIHVPGIIRWPGKIEAGSVSQLPVNGTDYLPSLCAVAGVDVPNDRVIDGANVFPGLTTGESVDRPIPMMWWLYHARGGKEVAMRSGDWKMLAHMMPQQNPGGHEDARKPKNWSIMKFIKESRLEGFSLYNLRNDAEESQELSQERPEEFQKLRSTMLELFREIQQEGPVLQLGANK